MNILVITQHIFPTNSPRASRSTELIKEFARQGYKVTCYAVLGNYDYTSFLKKYPNIILKNIPIYYTLKRFTSDGFLKKRPLIDKVLGKLFKKYLAFPEIEFYFNIPKILKQDFKYDLLISIGSPHQIHWGCAKAKKNNPSNFPNKWFADCGDPFMNNGKSSFPKYLGKLERLFCNLCDYILVPIENAKGGYYPEFREKIRVIPQGFYFDKNLSIQPINNTIPNFAYTGIFYRDIRNPKILMDYLVMLDMDFIFHIYTPFDDLIAPYKKLLGEKLKIHHPVSREKLIENLKEMDFVLNLQNEDDPHRLPSKLIDYAIVNKPILNIHPTKIDKAVLVEFLNGNYQNAYVVEDLEQYHIENIVKKFIDLM